MQIKITPPYFIYNLHIISEIRFALICFELKQRVICVN